MQHLAFCNKNCSRLRMPSSSLEAVFQKTRSTLRLNIYSITHVLMPYIYNTFKSHTHMVQHSQLWLTILGVGFLPYLVELMSNLCRRQHSNTKTKCTLSQ